MFSIYKSHQKHLYSKLVELSRNIFFYKKIQLKDNFETRIKLIFLHLSLILIIFREKNKDNFPQDVFDNIFLNIEYHIRELGYGDVSVNKKMKELVKIFYDILLNLRLPKKHKNRINKSVLKNYFELQLVRHDELSYLLVDYFEQFYYFCFEIENNSVLKGGINFKFK